MRAARDARRICLRGAERLAGRPPPRVSLCLVESFAAKGDAMDQQQYVDFVLRTIEERNIRFIRLWFTDVLGRLKSFAISPEDLETAFEEGIGFDGSSIEGFTTREETDMLVFPDPTSFQIMPWRSKEQGTARIFCNVRMPNGEPFPGDPRACLERVFRQAEKMGYLMNVGGKTEFYYFPNDHSTELMDSAGYFDLTPDDPAFDIRRSTVLSLEKMSVPVEYSYHADGPGQQCLSLRHAEALTFADALTTAKYVIRFEAYEKGIHASFMPKPLAKYNSSGMFLYQSLLDHEGNNVFWDESDEHYHLSDVAKHYMAGILAYAPQFMAITNPTVNSYKRITNGNGGVPTHATWGLRNRSAMIRIPTYKPGKQLSTRIELRTPDPMSNPYLVCAVTLAAGLRGIREGLELPPEATVDTLRLSDRQLSQAGYTSLPRTLGEALDAFESSQLMYEALGDHIHSFFLRKKRDEWAKYSAAVTDWEIRHYLGNS